MTEEVSTMRSQLDELIKEREALEIEADGIRSFLTTPGPNGAPPPGLRGVSLVDNEGFPRADIDVYDTRVKRHRLSCIETDYGEVMKRIEQLVKDLHAATRNLKPSVSSSQQQQDQPSKPTRQPAAAIQQRPAAPESQRPPASAVGEEEEKGRPFALIDQVFRGSPAEECGLTEGDKLIAFGSVNAETVSANFAEVVSLVQNSVGRPIQVVVRRGGARQQEVVSVSLVPHTWSGRGLLGCHLSPLTSTSS